MIPTLALREKAMQLLAADTATLAQAADANVIVLIKEPFTPGESLALGDLTPADFDGSTPLECGLGTQPEGQDPANTDALITLESPAGGWRWETTGVTNLPQTIYGYALMTDGLAALLGADTLPTPIDLTGVNQVVQLGALGFRQLAGSIT